VKGKGGDRSGSGALAGAMALSCCPTEERAAGARWPSAARLRWVKPLRRTRAAWTGQGHSSYQWERAGSSSGIYSDITNAHAAAYMLADEDTEVYQGERHSA